MGACSSKPKTAEFEGSMNFCLQEELARKTLDDEQKGGCTSGLKSIDPEQKISSKCSLQNLPLAMENEHGRTEDVLLESEKEHLAGSSLENNEKETCARAEETCDGKPHFVAERESQVSEIGTDTSKLQKEKPSVGQEIYEELAFAQKEDFSGSGRNSVLFKEDVVELPQKAAFRDVENGKFQTLENINEDKELPTFEGGKPRIDAEDGNPASCRAIQESVSRVANANLKLKLNPAGNLTNCETEKTAACSASKAANGTMLLPNGKSGDVTFEKQSEPKGLEYGAQRHDLEEALTEQSAPLIVSKAQDSEWTNLNSMVARSTNGLLAVEENDGTQVGLRKGSKEPFSVAGTIESIITEALDSQTSNVSEVCKEANCSEDYASKTEHGLIFCSDEIKNFKVVDMSKEQVIDYESHSAAFQPPQTFEELNVVEPPRSIYGGKDMASDIDEVLEKLASEFVRQESLSSFLP